MDSKSKAADSTASIASAARHSNHDDAPTASTSVTVGTRPRFELPWLVLAALLVGTLVAAYKSDQRADAAAARRFQEITRAAELSLQHDIQANRDMLESAAAFILVLPNASIDARTWTNFFKRLSADGENNHSLMRIDYVPHSAIATD